MFQTDRPLIILGLAADETVQKFVNSVLFRWTSCELFIGALLTASVDLCTTGMVWICTANAGQEQQLSPLEEEQPLEQNKANSLGTSASGGQQSSP